MQALFGNSLILLPGKFQNFTGPSFLDEKMRWYDYGSQDLSVVESITPWTRGCNAGKFKPKVTEAQKETEQLSNVE